MREAKPMTPVTMRTGGTWRRVCGHISQAICMRCRRVGRLRERYTGQASIDEASWQADATETFSQTLQSYCQQLVGPVTGDAPLNPKHRQRDTTTRVCLEVRDSMWAMSKALKHIERLYGRPGRCLDTSEIVAMVMIQGQPYCNW